MNPLSLSDQEVLAIKNLLAELSARYTSVEDDDFLKDASVISHELPKRVRYFLNDFKKREPDEGCCLISGYPIDEDKVGRTPEHWNSRSGVSPTLEEEMLLVLYGSLLGDVFGWATQQDGYIVHDVMPIKGMEYSQISSGSLQDIWWHTEDAFHPMRGDWVGLFCLRNPDRVPTTVSCLSPVQLTEETLKVLFEPRFIIRPDDSHAERNGTAPAEHREVALDLASQHLRELKSQPPRVAVLFGDTSSPYVRIDPFFMDPIGDTQAEDALKQLTQAIDANLAKLVLQPGDCLLVDNYRTVHGRKAFKARYDGADRWLKRINVTDDLRKSSAYRPSYKSRLIT